MLIHSTLKDVELKEFMEFTCRDVKYTKAKNIVQANTEPNDAFKAVCLFEGSDPNL